MHWNFASAFESIADSVGSQTALIHGEHGVRRTWAELDDRAARVAGALAAAGLGPDSKVASYLYNGPEYMEALVGTFKLRAVPVNINYRYLEDELVYLLDNSDAEALLFHASLAGHVANVRARAPRLKLLVQVDDETSAGAAPIDGAVAYEELLASTEPMARVDRTGDELLLLYTGGTTGMPKGVMWRNEDLFGVLADAVYGLVGESIPDASGDAGPVAQRIAAASRTPVHLPASPLMHGTGMFSSFQSLLSGGAIVTLAGRTFDPHELWRVVETAKVTQMAIVGDAFCKPMLVALREAERDGKPYDTSSLTLVISSGVMWSADVKRELMERVGCICFDSLGSSEGVGFANSITMPGAAATTAKFTIGSSAKVLTDDGREVEPGSGEVGMLAVGGYIPLGYYKDETKSATTFRELAGRRWSIPGDFATVELDGTISLLGRGSVVINSGGEKIFPEEVEEAVKAHPAVLDALVVGLPDERFGEAVTAVVTLAPGTQATAAELAAALESLARFKHPRRWVFVDDVLRAANGKADYKAAKARALEDTSQ